MAVMDNKEVAGCLMDMAKFYDHIDLSIMAKEGHRLGYPLKPLLLALEVAQGTRYLKKYSFMSADMRAWTAFGRHRQGQTPKEVQGTLQGR